MSNGPFRSQVTNVYNETSSKTVPAVFGNANVTITQDSVREIIDTITTTITSGQLQPAYGCTQPQVQYLPNGVGVAYTFAPVENQQQWQPFSFQNGPYTVERPASPAFTFHNNKLTSTDDFVGASHGFPDFSNVSGVRNGCCGGPIQFHERNCVCIDLKGTENKEKQTRFGETPMKEVPPENRGGEVESQAVKQFESKEVQTEDCTCIPADGYVHCIQTENKQVQTIKCICLPIINENDVSDSSSCESTSSRSSSPSSRH